MIKSETSEELSTNHQLKLVDQFINGDLTREELTKNLHSYSLELYTDGYSQCLEDQASQWMKTTPYPTPNFKYTNVLYLQTSDLFPQHIETPFDDITFCSFKDSHQIQEADLVIYTNRKGKYKVIKCRF